MNLSVRKLTIAGLLGAISVVMGMVPMLGFITVPSAAGAVTIMHVPAILGGVAEGPVVGALVGLIFGLMSFLRATSPLFADPLVAILPRLFIGVTAWAAYQGLRRFGQVPGLAGAAIVGTLTNTGLVLGMAVVRHYLVPEVALATAAIHGLPEVIVAGLVVTAVGMALARAGFIARVPHSSRGSAA